MKVKQLITELLDMNMEDEVLVTIGHIDEILENYDRDWVYGDDLFLVKYDNNQVGIASHYNPEM